MSDNRESEQITEPQDQNSSNEESELPKWALDSESEVIDRSIGEGLKIEKRSTRELLRRNRS